MDTIEARIKARMSREIVGLNFFKNVNVNMPNRNEYSQTKREIRFFQILFDNAMNEDDENYKRIRAYIEKTENQYPETQRFEEVFDEYDVSKDRDLKLADYLLRICSKYQGTQTQVFATTFVSGVSFDFKSRERYLKEILPFLANENILLIHDATFFANYSKGFLITESMIVDLKTKQKLDFADIIDCVFNNNSVNVIGNGKDYLSLSVSNPVIKYYLESIIKCYSSYKGKILREETDRLNQEINRENKISSYAENSKDVCFDNGIKLLNENDLAEAEFNFIALGRISDSQEEKMLSYAGMALCNYNNKDKFIENISKAIQCQVNKNNTEFKAKVKTLIDCVTGDGKALLSVIVSEGDIQALRYFLEFELDVDFNKVYNNATLLDIVIYNRKFFREKTDNYKEIENILQDKGCERKWNVEYNRPYIPTLNIQEIIKQSIFKCIEKSNNEIKVGEDLRRSIPDKCQKAAINLGVRYENPIYLIYDNTTFKSLKYGFAICGDGIYIASEMGEHLFIPWRDFLQSQVAINNGYIFFEGAKISVNQINAMNLYKLFDDLKYEISEYGVNKSDSEQCANKDEVPIKEEVLKPEEVQEPEEVQVEEEVQKQEEAQVEEEVQKPEEVQVEEVQKPEEVQVEEVQKPEEVQVEEVQKPEEVQVEEVQKQEEPQVEEVSQKQEEAHVEEEAPKLEKNTKEIGMESIIEPHIEIQVSEISNVEVQKTEKVSCSNCGAILDATAMFCKMCGTKVEIKADGEEKINEQKRLNISPGVCPECSTVNRESAFFCKRCGFKLK